MSGPTGKEDHPGPPNANILPRGDSDMPGSEQHGSSDIVVFRDLDIELTGWPSGGDGIGFRSREVVPVEEIGPILLGISTLWVSR